MRRGEGVGEVIVKIELKYNKLYRFLALSFTRVGLKKASIYFSNKWARSMKIRVGKGKWKSAGMDGEIEFE